MRPRGRRALPFADASLDVMWTKYLPQCIREKPIISRNKIGVGALFQKRAPRSTRSPGTE